MKKFFAFVLAMGVSVVANAGLMFDANSYTVNVGETITFSVTSDADYYGGGLFFVLGNDPLATPSIAGFYDSDYVGIPENSITSAIYWMPEPITQMPILTGPICSFDILGLAQGDIALTMYSDDDLSVLDSAVVRVIPEPLTVTLLSLGGLAAFRRR